MRWTPRTLRIAMNLWPPYLGAGIRVRRIAADWREVVVELRQGIANRNYYGDHYGGSLYSMTDPFYALMLIQLLGCEYFVHHAAGEIEYLAPARGTVSSRFALGDADLEAIREKTAGGEKYLPRFTVDIVDRSANLVARAAHTIYVRRRARKED